jgi:hypothetical protein
VLPLSVRPARQTECRRDTVLLDSAPLAELHRVSSASLFRCVWCIYWEDVAMDGPCPLGGALDDYGKTRKAMAACNGPDLNVGNAISRQHGMFESRVVQICRFRSISNPTLIRVVVDDIANDLRSATTA